MGSERASEREKEGEGERWPAVQCIKELSEEGSKERRESAWGMRHRPVKQGGAEQRRKSGREESNK